MHTRRMGPTSDVNEVPLRERRRAATRRDIEIAAADLFEAQGYDPTTVEQIADRAGVSMRTFYRYCRGKDDAIASLLGPGPENLAALVAARDDLPLLEAVIEGFVEATAADGGDTELHRRLLRVIVQTAPLRSAWLAAGRAAQDELSVLFAARRPGLDPLASDALAAATTATLTVAIEAWAKGEQASIRSAAQKALGVIAPAFTD